MGNMSDLIIKRYVMPAIESNMYVLIEDEDAIIIDPNINYKAFQILKENNVKKIKIFLTHEHFDHISGVNWLKENFESKVICSENAAKALIDPSKNLAKFWDVIMIDKPQDVQKLGLTIKDEEYVCKADEAFVGTQIWSVCGHKVKAIQAPGHSKGSVIYCMDNIVFSGDSLINGYGVICRLPGGSWKQYCEKTLPLFEKLSDDTIIFPGHGNPDYLKKLRKFLVKFNVGKG